MSVPLSGSLTLKRDVWPVSDVHSGYPASIIVPVLLPKPLQADVSLNEALERAGYGIYQTKLLFVCGLCSACDAMEVIVLTFLLQQVRTDWAFTNAVAGLISASFSGVFVGNLVFGFVSDRYGRWYGYVGSAFLTFFFGILSAFSPNVPILCFLRFLTAVGLGGGHVSFTLYSEFCPATNRGRLLLINQMFWSVGSVIEVLIAWTIIPHFGWRGLLIASTLPMLIVLAFASFVPESPRFLAVKGRLREAHDLLDRVSLDNGGGLHLLGEWELQELPSGARTSIKGRIELLLSHQLKSTTLRLWLLFFCSAATYYGIVLISPRFFSSESEYSSILIASLSEFPFLAIPWFGIDRFGRRRTLATSYILCALACIALTTAHITANLTIAGLFAARGCIDAAFISLYVVTTESYGTSLRSTAFGLATATARIGGATTSFLSQTEELQMAMAVFALVALVAAWASITLPHETANNDLPVDVVTDEQDDVMIQNLLQHDEIVLQCVRNEFADDLDDHFLDG